MEVFREPGQIPVHCGHSGRCDGRGTASAYELGEQETDKCGVGMAELQGGTGNPAPGSERFLEPLQFVWMQQMVLGEHELLDRTVCPGGSSGQLVSAPHGSCRRMKKMRLAKDTVPTFLAGVAGICPSQSKGYQKSQTGLGWKEN